MGKQISGLPQGRIVSLDVLRGFDMFWLIGGEAFFHRFFGLFKTPFTDSLSGQFEHSVWNGFTFYDLIFPLFIFISGASITIALGRRVERGMSKKELYGYILKRFAILMLLGLIMNGFMNFDFANIRYAGVLQRIALCYLFTAIIFIHTSRRVQFALAGAFLLVYWGLLTFVPVPGFGAGVLTPDGNFASYIDRLFLPGKFCCFEFGDNEGLLSTLPAVVSCLLGVFAGYWLLSNNDEKKKTFGLLGGGAALLVLGLIWNLVFPINKLIWSSSYVLYAGGWSVLLLALFYWIVDVKKIQRWGYYFMVIGLNPITIYVGQRLINFEGFAMPFIGGIVNLSGIFGPVLVVLCTLVLKVWFLDFLHKHKVYLRA